MRHDEYLFLMTIITISVIATCISYIFVAISLGVSLTMKIITGGLLLTAILFWFWLIKVAIKK